MKSLRPKCGKKVGMKMKSLPHIIDGTDHVFRPSILLRIVREIKTQCNTIRCKMVMKVFIVVFPSVVTLKLFDGL